MNTMNSRVEDFMKMLRGFPSSDSVYNHYKEDLPYQNLSVYLQYLARKRPVLLMIGEAPGYKGCRLTGIPFTSGEILYHNACFFPLREKLLLTNLKTKKETTASIVYKVLDPQLFRKIVLWNAFPFHPHKIKNKNSNRAPTAGELEVGISFLEWLIEFFGITRLITVGRVAEKTIHKFFPELECMYVRHPSHGGAREFAEGFYRIMRKLNLYSRLDL